MTLDYFLWGHMKDMGYWQKIKGKRTTAPVNQPADCIREYYTLRRATNSL
jgi:hypothetical protein